MSDKPHFQTAPEDRIPFAQKIAYGTGGLVNNLLGAAISMMAIVLNTGLKIDPAVVGLLMGLPRFTDAFTDPVMGFISDHTKSKWGRRRPYIVAGAIFAGIVFALMWQLRQGWSHTFYFWFFLVGSIVFFVGYTIFATPWVALGYEMTPDYHERTRLMAVANYFGQIPWLLLPWFYWIMYNPNLFDDPVAGARGLAIGVGVVVVTLGVIPGIFCKERYKAIAAAEDKVKEGFSVQAMVKNFFDFLKGFWETLKCVPFLKLCLATFLVFNSFMLISGLTSYAIIYYIYGGNHEMGGKLMGLYGTSQSIFTFLAIYVTTWVSTKIGKRNAFFFSTGVSIFGYAIKWFCYSPENPHLLLVSTPFVAFGLGGLFTLMGAMIADVCDLDELTTGERREGMFGSIFWWNVKLGSSLALALSGFLLNATGFDVNLAGAQGEDTLFMLRLYDVAIPIVASLIAIASIYTYNLTEARAHEVRAELEKRRGKAQ